MLRQQFYVSAFRSLASPHPVKDQSRTTQISDEQTCARTGCFSPATNTREEDHGIERQLHRVMDGPPKLGVSGKNWTAAARAPGKLLLKLIFQGCAHCRADGRIFVGNRLHLAIHPYPIFNIPIQVVCAL